MISLLVAVPLGVFSALYRNRPARPRDPGRRNGRPRDAAFWFGLLLVELFSLHLRLLPVSGYGSGFFGHLKSLTLPAITSPSISRPLVIRTLRSSLIETLTADYVTSARARGFHEKRVVGKHALRNALIATMTILAINIGYLIAAAW